MGRSAASAISTSAANVLASLVSFTDGRACSPTSWYQDDASTAADIVRIPVRSSTATIPAPSRAHLFQRGAAGRLGRRHHRALDDRRVADHDRRGAPRRASRPPFRCWSRRRRDRPGWRRPRPTRRWSMARHDRLDVGAEPAIRFAAAPRERHFVAHHLAHHVGRALARPRGECETMTMPTLLMPPLQRVAHTARTISATERAPGSTWPICGRRGTRRGRAAPSSAWSPPPRRRPCRRRPLGRRLAQRGAAPAPARPAWSSGRHRTCRAPSPPRSRRRRRASTSARLGFAGSSLPSAMNSVPNSGPEAPPTFITSVVPIACSASGSGLAANASALGQHRLEAALHVQPMVAVADRLVERRQFLGMGDDGLGHRLHQLAPDRLIDCHGHAPLSAGFAARRRGEALPIWDGLGKPCRGTSEIRSPIRNETVVARAWRLRGSQRGGWRGMAAGRAGPPS